MAGSFITLEGVEGSGKTSLIKSLEKHFQSLNKEVLVTREPGGCKLGLQVREILLHAKISSLAELLLFAADRAEHIETVIKPALEANKVVLCDRYIHSTLAYQGYGRGIDMKQIELLNNLATGGLQPEKVLLLDLDVEEGLKRAASRSDDPDSWTRFEEEKLEFHNKIRAGFKSLAGAQPELFSVINASKSQEDVLAQSIEAL